MAFIITVVILLPLGVFALIKAGSTDTGKKALSSFWTFLLNGKTLVAIMALASLISVLTGHGAGLYTTVVVLVALTVAVTLHEASHYIFGRLSGMAATEFYAGFGPEVFGYTYKGTRYGLRALPLGGYVKLVGMSDLEDVGDTPEKKTYRAASFPRKFISVFMGPFTNVILAVVCFAIAVFAYGILTPSTTLAQVEAGSPAATAGIQAGDHISRIQNITNPTWDQVLSTVDNNTSVSLTLTHKDGTSYTTTVTKSNGKLGILAGSKYVKPNLTKGASDVASLTRRVSWGILVGLYHTPAALTRTALHISTPSKIKDTDRAASPVGIVQVGGYALKSGAQTAWLVYGAFNLLLGIFNLLPLLPFDGGHLAVATLESALSKVRRRKVTIPVSLLNTVTIVVFGLLVLISLMSLFLDITKPLQNPFG